MQTRRRRLRTTQTKGESVRGYEAWIMKAETKNEAIKKEVTKK